MTEIHRGLDGVVVGETRLSHVDGEAGVLLIGGYPLEELAPNARFEETLFLLWNDRLPRPSELEQLHDGLASRRALPPVTRECLREAAAAGLDAMDALRIGLASLGVAHPELHRIELQREDAAATQRRALRLVAAMATLATAYQRLREGEEPVAPDPSLGHAANTLYMFSGRVPERGAVRALETYLNTAVDHGMSASTFAARVIASTRSDLASAVVGALGALKGPLHGGAPGPALDMVFACRAEAARTGRPLSEVTDAWVRRTLAEGGRVMGFGHRVYKVRDPRADVLAAAVERLFPQPGANPLYDDARAVEAVVLEVLAELKPGRRLQTNVEFYTALLLHGLGLPSAAFTPTFAVARVGGWTAHVLEQVAADRLIRPLVAYVGARDRRWREAQSRTAERPARV